MSSQALLPDAVRKQRVHALAVSLLVLAFLAALTHRRAESQNELSRLVAVDGLVLRGEFNVDDSPVAMQVVEARGRRFYAMIDMVYNKRNGHFYSSKPPVFTLLLAAPAALVRAAGDDFSFTEPGSPPAVFLLTLLTIGLPTAAAFYVFRIRIGRRLRPLDADLATVLTLGGTLFLSYSVTVNHHTFTALLVLFAFFLLGMDRGRRHIGPLATAGAGFLMGLSAAVDVGHGVMFALAFGLYLLFYVRSWRALFCFGLGSIPPLAVHCAVQYSIWGSILPVQMMGGTKDYPLSYWHVMFGPDAWCIPRSYYWLLTLFSTRGLFVLSPILLVGVACLVGGAARAMRGGRADAAAASGAEDGEEGRGYAALTVLFGVVLLCGYFSFVAATNFGGWCFGFRYYVGFAPLLAFYAARAYEEHRDDLRFRVVFYVLGLISLTYALMGARYTWDRMESIAHPAVRILRVLRGF